MIRTIENFLDNLIDWTDRNPRAARLIAGFIFTLFVLQSIAWVIVVVASA